MLVSGTITTRRNGGFRCYHDATICLCTAISQYGEMFSPHGTFTIRRNVCPQITRYGMMLVVGDTAGTITARRNGGSRHYHDIARCLFPALSQRVVMVVSDTITILRNACFRRCHDATYCFARHNNERTQCATYFLLPGTIEMRPNVTLCLLMRLRHCA